MSDTGIDILVVPILGFSLVAFVVAILALIGRVAKRKWEAARADRLAETGRERDLYVITLIDRNDHRSVRVLFFDNPTLTQGLPTLHVARFSTTSSGNRAINWSIAKQGIFCMLFSTARR
jgi:hypothetical protein